MPMVVPSGARVGTAKAFNNLLINFFYYFLLFIFDMEENNTSAELKNQKFKYFHKFYELGLWISIDSELDKELERIKKLLTSYGAEIFFVDSFNKRKMAYPVKKQTMGYFGYLLFKLDNGENILEIKNNLRKINSILRFIIIKRKYLFSKEFNNKKEEVIKK